MTSNASYTLLATEQLANIIEITDTTPILTGSVNIVLPIWDGAQRTVYNNTLQSLIFIATSGSGVIVPPNTQASIYCNGTNWVDNNISVAGQVYGAQRVPTAFYNSATGVATGPAQLSFLISGHNVSFEASINLQNAGAGGAKIGIVGPSGALISAGIQGVATGNIAQNDYLTGQTAISTGIYGLPVNSQVCPVWVSGIVTSSAGCTGPVQIGFIPGVNGATAVMLANSFLTVLPST